MGWVIRGLIFDFDGLILDTEMPIYQAWAEQYRRHGQELSPEFWATIVGYGVDHFDAAVELERRLGRAIDRDAVDAERRLRETELLLQLDVLPGVREWRADAIAAGIRLGVASNSSRRWVTGHLQRLGLYGWTCVRCADDVERTKPAPDVYLAVLACLGLDASEVVAVEDSGSGVRAARAAGLYCVAVPNVLTAGHDLSQADRVLGSLAEARFADVAADAWTVSARRAR